MDVEPLRTPQDLTQTISDRKQAIWFRIATMWESVNEPGRALTAYEAVIRLNSSHVPTLHRVGILRQKDHLPSSISSSISYLLTAVNLEPSNGSAWASLAYSYVIAGDFDKAYHAYYNALTKNADRIDPYLWHGVGLLYDRLGLLDDAVAAFAAVLGLASSLFEKTDEVYYALGIIYKEKGDYASALAYMSKVVSLNSSPGALAEAYYQIGIIQELAGNFTNAAEAYTTALGNQNHVKSMQSFAWLKHKMGKSGEAVEMLQQAMQIDDSDGCCSYLLGRIYMVNNEYRIAYDNYQRAVHIDNSNANYWCSIAALYFQRQQHRDAMNAFSRAMNISTNIPEVWYDLGTLYETYKQYNDALNAYRRASELQPQNTRFVERHSVMQHVLQSGITPQPPTGKPASEDIFPIPSAVRRARYKSDAPVRYGPLPSPPDAAAIQQYQQKRAPPSGQMNYSSALSATPIFSQGGPLAIARPADVANGASIGQARTSFSAGVSSHVANDTGTHSTSVIASVPDRQQRGSDTAIPNGQSPRHVVSRQEEHSARTANMASANGSVQRSLLRSPNQLSTVDNTRLREASHKPVSPEVRRNTGPSRDQNPLSTQSQERHPMTSERIADGSSPQQVPKPLSHLINPQTTQMAPTGGNQTPGRSHREDSTWRTRAEMASAESRVLPDPFVSRPEVSSASRDVEVGSQMLHPGAGQALGYSSLRNSVPQMEQGLGTDHMKRDVSGSGLNTAGRSPTARSHLSNGRDSQVPKYIGVQQSNSASSLPTMKRTISPVMPSGNNDPKLNTSDEPSRRSVSSSRERTGHLQEHAISNGDKSSIQNVGNIVVGNVEDGSRAFQSSPHMKVSLPGDRLGVKGASEKAGSPVDEEMLPKLPPLPAAHKEDGTSLVDAQQTRQITGASGALPQEGGKRENVVSKDNVPGNSFQALPRTRSPEQRFITEPNRFHAKPETTQQSLSANDASSKCNILEENPQSRAMLHPHLYRRADGTAPSKEEPSFQGFGDRGARNHTLQQTGAERGNRASIETSSKVNGQGPLPGGDEAAPEIESTTAITTGEHRRHFDQERHERIHIPPPPVASQRPENGTNHPLRQFSKNQVTEPRSTPRPLSDQPVQGRNDVSNGQARVGFNTHSPENRVRLAQTGAVPLPVSMTQSPLHRGGIPSRDAICVQQNGNGNMLDGRMEGDGMSKAQNFPNVSSIRNPFGSGAAPSFSKSLSRVGGGGSLGISSVNRPLPSETTARTAISEGLHLRTNVEEERLQIRRKMDEEGSGLGKRSTSMFENGSFRPRESSENDRGGPKPSGSGLSVAENQFGSKTEGPHRLAYNGGIGSQYFRSREGNGHGDEHRDLKRVKPHAIREPYPTNRFNGDL